MSNTENTTDKRYVSVNRLALNNDLLRAELINRIDEKIDESYPFSDRDQFDKAYLTNGWYHTYDDGEWFVYNDNGTNFTYTMPNPKKGSVAITLYYDRKIGDANKAAFFYAVYDDGTSVKVDWPIRTLHTYITDANKTLVQFTGSWGFEYNVYIRLSDWTMMASYRTPIDLSTYATVDELEELRTYVNEQSIVVDEDLSLESKNPVENQAITNWLNENVNQYSLVFDEETNSVRLSATPLSVGASPSVTANDPEDTNGNTIGASHIEDTPITPEWGNIRNKPDVYSKEEIDQAIAEATPPSFTTFGFQNVISTFADAPSDGDGMTTITAEKNDRINFIAGNSLIEFYAEENSLETAADSITITVYADPEGKAEELVGVHDASTTAHADIRELIQTLADSMTRIQIVTWEEGDSWDST